MRAEFFVDTGGWFALAEPKDVHHLQAATALRARIERGERPITTNLVIAETHALLLRRSHRVAGLAFLRQVRRGPNVIVTSDTQLEERARLEWVERYADHSFSLTDAVSFSVMTERGINEALGTDRHFRAAGFTLVP